MELELSECLPIDCTEEVVEQSEDDELSVEQFVDAALPSQKKVKEGPQTCISHSAGVRHCHRSFFSADQQAVCGMKLTSVFLFFWAFSVLNFSDWPGTHKANLVTVLQQ